jgi:hypothetical protein
MKGTLAVAAREIAERKLLFFGAFVAGLLPLGLPLLPALRGNAHDARIVAMLFLAATISLAFPLVFGTTILVGDIAQKRLSFLFSRPLPATSIWAGKLLGALLITIGCASLAVAPIFFVEGESAFSYDTFGFGSRGPLVLAIPGVLLLLLLAHVVASMARLRSAWVVLDFFLAVVFAVAITLSIRSLFFTGFWEFHEGVRPRELQVPLWWLPLSVLAVLLAASCVQVADGRTDARRSHGALSATLWGLTAVFTAILGGLAWWVASAGPQDLVAFDGGIQTVPRGSWVALAGAVRNRGAADAAFLYDTASGRYVKLHGSGEVAFSADGAHAVWFEESQGFFERKRSGALRIASLDAVEPAAIVSDVETNVWAEFALSPSGRRLAVLESTVLTAYDVSSPGNPKQLAAIRLEDSSRTLVFVDEDTIRLVPRYYNGPRRDIAPAALEITELSLPSKKSLVTGRIERDALPRLRISADGRYLVGTRDKRLTLHDGHTGSLVATLSEDLEAPKMRFLPGGRMAVAGIAGASARLLFFEGEKASARSIELGPAASVVLGGEIAPGRVAVALNPFRSNDERSRHAWKLAFADVVTGAVSSGPDGLVPADRFSWWSSPVLPPAEDGSPASKLFLDASSALVHLDPATGKQEVLLGGRR